MTNPLLELVSCIQVRMCYEIVETSGEGDLTTVQSGQESCCNPVPLLYPLYYTCVSIQSNTRSPLFEVLSRSLETQVEKSHSFQKVVTKKETGGTERLTWLQAFVVASLFLEYQFDCCRN